MKKSLRVHSFLNSGLRTGNTQYDFVPIYHKLLWLVAEYTFDNLAGICSSNPPNCLCYILVLSSWPYKPQSNISSSIFLN